MAMITNCIHILTAIVLLAVCNGCGRNVPDTPDKQVVIIYDNDVHCAVDGYAALAAIKKSSATSTPYITTVSCGDFSQGDVVGSITRGEGIIEIINRTGYDLLTLGNHEFDFGMEQHKYLADKLQGEIICSNFTQLQSNEPVYQPYSIISYGDVEIAYIGAATPATATSVSPKTFQDKNGNALYSFLPDNMFKNIQRQVNLARRKGADYVVVLSHLGDVKDQDFPTSIELIANTSGIDAVLDGHSHSVIPDSIVLDKKGKQVHLSSSGSRFENIGILTLSTDGKFSARLVDRSQVQPDSLVMEFVQKVKQDALQEGNRVIGKSLVDLNALDQDNNWLVRDRETPLGNFCADAFRIMLDTDIAMVNGGGIRTNIPAGEITYNSLISVFPFNNTACKAEITGAALLDALEASVMSLPLTSGSFMQVSGIKFNTDHSVASPVVMGPDGLFSHIGNGPKRVSDVKVLDKESGEYLPVDVSRVYTLGGISYNITDMGCEGIFRYTRLLQDNLGQDVDILSGYLDLLGGTIGEEYKNIEGRILKH